MSGLDDFGGDYHLQFCGIMDITNWCFMALHGPFKLHSTHQGGRKQSNIIGPDWLNTKPCFARKAGHCQEQLTQTPLFYSITKIGTHLDNLGPPMAPLSAPLVRTERRRRPQSGNPDFFLYLLLVSYLLHLFCSCNWICFHFSLRVEGERDSIYRRTQEAKLFEQIVLVATNRTITHFFTSLHTSFYVGRGSLGKLWHITSTV